MDELCGGARCLAEDDPSDASSPATSSGQYHPGTCSYPDVEDMVKRGAVEYVLVKSMRLLLEQKHDRVKAVECAQHYKGYLRRQVRHVQSCATLSFVHWA